MVKIDCAMGLCHKDPYSLWPTRVGLRLRLGGPFHFVTGYAPPTYIEFDFYS
jgi:hypothetical protein